MDSHLVIAGYFAAFALVHSILADSRTKEWARRSFSLDGRRYRLAYNLASLATTMPLIYLLAVLPDRTLYLVPSPWRWAMVLLQILALAGGARALMEMGAPEFLGLRKDRIGFTTKGLHSRVRNPLFSFAVLLIWLTPFMTRNLLALNLLMTVYFYLGALHEERQMLAAYGPDYEGYRKRVPGFVPRSFREKDGDGV